MNIIQFLTFFLLLTVIGTLSVTGWYFITRGEEEILPDGSRKKVGKIFKAWYFFWTREKHVRFPIFYRGDEFRKLLIEFSRNYPQAKFIEKGNYFQLVYNGALDLLTEIELKWEINLTARPDQDGGHTLYEAYKTFPVYVFPEIIRTPLAECATCFSSIYGSLFYWFAIWLVQEPLFEWSSMPGFAAVFFWVTFCFELSVLNTALAKKF